VKTDIEPIGSFPEETPDVHNLIPIDSLEIVPTDIAKTAWKPGTVFCNASNTDEPLQAIQNQTVYRA
jgi:hypothetical protein